MVAIEARGEARLAALAPSLDEASVEAGDELQAQASSVHDKHFDVDFVAEYCGGAPNYCMPNVYTEVVDINVRATWMNGMLNLIKRRRCPARHPRRPPRARVAPDCQLANQEWPTFRLARYAGRRVCAADDRVRGRPKHRSE
jgi:hypothetical protein